MRWAVLLIPVILAPACRKDAPPGPRTRLEVVPVDDSIDPLDHFDAAKLPPGATIEMEYGADGPSHHPNIHYARMPAGADPHGAEEQLRSALASVSLPPQRQLAFGPIDGGWVRSWVLRGAPVLRENDIEKATAQFDAPTKQASVMITLGAGGARRFEDATRANVDKRMAIVLGGEVDSAPVIRSAIGGGRLQITLGADKSASDARALAKRLGN